MRKVTFAQLSDALLSRRDLERLGMEGAELARALRSGRIHRVRQGRYAPGDLWRSLRPEDRHRLEVAAAHREVQDGGVVVSHASAAAIHGLPLYRCAPPRVDVIVPEGHRASNSGCVRRHTDQLDEDDIVIIDGMRVTSLARTAFDVARTLPAETALSCVDAALRREAMSRRDYDEDRAEEWRDELRARLAAAAGIRGVRQARHLAELADGRAESPGESVSRLQLHRLGFATPQLQVPVPGPDGGTLWIDFGLDDVHAWGECDGRGKYEDESQRGGRTPEQVLYDEKRREDYVRGRTGRPFARWGSEDYPTPQLLARRLRAYDIHPPSTPAAARRPAFV